MALLFAMVFAAGSPLFAADDSKKACIECHVAPAKLRESVTAHQPLRDGKCKWCHRPHGTANVAILHASGGRALCVICHKDLRPKDAEQNLHHFREEGECLPCHAPHDSGRKKLLRKRSRFPAGSPPADIQIK